MYDEFTFTTLLIIIVPSIILTSIIVWVDSIQQKKEKDWHLHHRHIHHH